MLDFYHQNIESKEHDSPSAPSFHSNPPQNQRSDTKKTHHSAFFGSEGSEYVMLEAVLDIHVDDEAAVKRQPPKKTARILRAMREWIAGPIDRFRIATSN